MQRQAVELVEDLTRRKQRRLAGKSKGGGERRADVCSTLSCEHRAMIGPGGGRAKQNGHLGVCVLVCRRYTSGADVSG